MFGSAGAETIKVISREIIFEVGLLNYSNPCENKKAELLQR